jgi:DNA-binding CsgD family transcriptional regulator
MGTDLIERLSAREKEILRLVSENYEAKQIALRLGISPHTVNDHMRAARRTLGVARTMEAARLLTAYERPNRLGTEPIGIDTEPQTADPTEATPPDETVAVRKIRYRLGFLTRLGIIVALAFGAAAATGALIEVSDVITRLIQTRHIDLSDSPYLK